MIHNYLFICAVIVAFFAFLMSHPYNNWKCKKGLHHPIEFQGKTICSYCDDEIK